MTTRLTRRTLLAQVTGAAFATASGASFVACKSKGAEAKAEASRIVSLSPSTTEALFAMGIGNRVVGRSRYCDYPPEVATLPQVGGYVDPNLEAVLALRPDLVVGARGPAGPKLEATLLSHGIRTFFPETESFEQIREMMSRLGALTGADAGARAVNERVAAQTSAIENAVRESAKPKVMLVFGLQPVCVAGPGGFPDEMIKRAGGTNVVASGGAYPIIGFERVLALDPDIVLNAAMAEARGEERITKEAPGWKDVGAVKKGRVVFLADESILRPGPRVGDGLLVLARAIHPELRLP